MNALNRLITTVADSPIWKSIFRHGAPQDNRNRVLAVISNVFLHIHPVKVHRKGIQITHTFCLGGLSFLMFLVLTVTGVLLMFYYVPDVGRAYNDMKDLAYVVGLGVLLRNMHRWSAHAMVLLVILHMGRVFYTGSYRPPREFNWVVGVLLLVCTLMLSFTGYLLPWDQLAYWAVTVGTNMARATPFLGHKGPFALTAVDNDVRFAMLGGTIIGQNALIRFYVLHCVVVPLAAAALMAVHFWRIRKDGGISHPL
jgi:quinol-cytochrome oxidoreductase complex cytochrome b subunit